MTDASNSPAFIQLIQNLRQQLQAARHRHCLLLSGSPEWTRDQASLVIETLSIQSPVWLSQHEITIGSNIPQRQAGKLLGQEAELLVFDAHDGLDADALGAVSGVVAGGGLLLILAPPLNDWPSQPDAEAVRFFPADGDSLYLQRLIRCAREASGVSIIQQGQTLPKIVARASTTTPNLSLDTLCRTHDQQQAVNAILKVATGHRRRPAVLVSDRGRGKSSALGIAAGTLLQHGLQRIIVTGPRLDATSQIFERAGQVLAARRLHQGQLECDDGVIEYASPDELIANRSDCDLLLVDEAAAIPMPLLSQLLQRYARVVFATTVHGYEGTGRGFALKFYRELDRKTPGWQQVRLEAPIRWAANDPLEAFIFDTLLLNAQLAETQAVVANECRYREISRDELMTNPQQLSQLFALLVLAHYRTRPNDLRQLLDSPDLSIFIGESNSQILAVALIIKEGELDAELAKAVYRGERRPQGHLIPQSLAVHAGLLEAPGLSYGRIMRIAVHPALQGQGIGSGLLGHIQQQDKGFDCLGSSFGVTPELYRFWQNAGFVPVRMGINREHSSGCHSLIMLRAMSEAGQTLTQSAQQKMRHLLPAQLTEPLQDLDPELALALLKHTGAKALELSIDNWQDLISFAHSNRGYDFCLAALQAFAHQTAGDSHWQTLESQERQLLVMKLLQRQAWPTVVKQCGLNGRTAAVKQLRQTMVDLIPQYCPPEKIAEIKKAFSQSANS